MNFICPTCRGIYESAERYIDGVPCKCRPTRTVTTNISPVPARIIKAMQGAYGKMAQDQVPPVITLAAEES